MFRRALSTTSKMGTYTTDKASPFTRAVISAVRKLYGWFSLICGIAHEICADGLFTLGIRRNWPIRVLIILVVSCLLDLWEVLRS